LKTFYILVSSLLFSILNIYAEARVSVTLSGKITDKITGDPLTGVTIYLPDFGKGTVSDTGGFYSIRELPIARVLIQVSYISYRTLFATIDLSVTNMANFEMEYTPTEINNVVITGLSKAAEQKRTPASITVVPKLTLLENASTNIIDALATQPGVAQITTGTGISKPVIRGMGYNRVILIHDGIRQEGQQWGDEHGIEIDEYSVDKVEILKGPASLAYGSDALAGVINMLSAPAPPDDKTTGNLTAVYQTNNGLAGFSGDLAGNRNGLIWDIRYSTKLSHAYKNPIDGFVLNSGFRENSAGIQFGLTKQWGYSNLKLSYYNMTPGLIEGERDSMTGRFIQTVPINDSTTVSEIVTGKSLRGYNPKVPYQKIRHYKAFLNSYFIFGNSSLRSVFGFQQNRRQEFGNTLEPEQYELFFLLNTLSYDIRYILPDIWKISASAGINGMYQSSRNKGEEYLVPEYDLLDIGVFVLMKKSLKKVDLSGGIRYDNRLITGKDLYLDTLGEKTTFPDESSVQKFAGFSSTFHGVSGSIGITWQISQTFFSKLNLSGGFRAPNIGELGSNGVHEGTLRYETGQPGLKAEKSTQVDFILGLNSEHISSELDLFIAHIQDYIFLQKLSRMNGGDSITEGLETFRYVSGNAQLSGGEIRIDIHPHPLDWIHFENAFSIVNAIQLNQSDSTRYLPMIPPPKIQTSLRLNFRKANNYVANAYVKFEIEHHMKQEHYFGAYGTETETPSYTLINAGFGGDFMNQDKKLCSLYFTINNLADMAYQSHLSRLKYGPVNYRTGRTGVYNMGRNFSFRLVVPLNFN